MIWVLGCKGQLGKEVSELLEAEKMPWVGTGREIDVTDINALQDFAKSIETSAYFPSALPHKERQINWIINCAAYTNVEKAEEEKDLAENINHIGALNVARTARNIGSKLIHISTDYVFDGNSNEPYTENAAKSPLNHYGKTKSLGEDAIMKEMTLYYIIRTSWLYGFDGNNFVYKIAKKMNENDSVQVVNDQAGTPTFAGDLANAVVKIIQKSENAKSLFGKNKAPSYGIYNFSNTGSTTFFDYANEIYRIASKCGKVQKNCNIVPCSSDEFESKAVRPKFSVLSTEKISAELKMKIPSWQTSLEKFIKSSRFQVK